MQAEVKREILLMVHRAKEKGVKLTCSCEILQLPLQRYCAWSRRDREEKLDGVSDPLLDGKPGPAPDEAPHGLLREEKEQISALLRDETYADLPPHQLAVVASEKGVVQASASSFYRQARKERLALTCLGIVDTPRGSIFCRYRRCVYERPRNFTSEKAV